MTPLESKLFRLAASLDAAALEALASKGLLRRAQKDLERGMETSIAGENGSSLRLRVGEFEVTLPESGPATATCSCPAAGVCQHILTAVLFLQKQPPACIQETLPGVSTPEPTLTPEQDLMSVNPEQLERWAGKADFKAGLKLASHYTPEILRERGFRIRFPALNSEVHIVPGGGLEGMIVSGGKGDGRQLVVAAVVGFQRAQGIQWAMPAHVATLEASDGAPRSRTEVLQSCQRLLDETLANGLSRLSMANQQRWATLAVSALGVNLPRLALLLRGIGDESALVLSRDARSDIARMFGRMAQAHALCTALQNGGDNPRSDLVGLHRTRYEEVGHLDLIGAAAWPWRTASGYEGLTVLFWDPSAKGWNSWTESRPRHQLADFKPVARYTQPGPWEGAESPRQLARGSFRLMNARRNPGNRLSGSSKSRVLVTGHATLREQGLVAIEEWSQLLQRANTQSAVGLMETNSLESIVALRPALWGEHGFDEVTQVFAWDLADSTKHSLLLEIGFDDFTEPAIRFLESVPPDSLQGALVIGRIQRTPRGLSLHPYSLHQQNGDLVHLCLDNLKDNPKAMPTKAATTPEAAEESFEDEEEAESATVFSPAISRMLDEVDDGLLALAEAGFASLNPLRVERVRQMRTRTDRLGLQGLAAGLGNVVAYPSSYALLRCSYLSLLHRRAMPLSS
jgi:hypothetical protein